MVVLFQITSFLSAFLLFAVQPMMAKALLPALGGSALVWGTCMVAFQSLLFAGYLVSHWILARWDLRRYAWVHVVLLLIAASLMQPFGVVSMTVEGSPWWNALVASLKHVGLPFFLLSFSTPMLQRWLTEVRCPGKNDPYRLFSTSNAGSLAALLTYPFLVEPWLTLSRQSHWWRVGLALMVVLIVILRVASRWRDSGTSVSGEKERRAIRFDFRWRVFALSAGSGALLLAVTNAITFDVSSAPLLWVLPLALYLGTFIVVFQRRPWLNERLARRGLPWWVSLGLTLFLMGRFHLGFAGAAGVLCHLVVVAFGCWLAHARMAGLKPADERALTGYYVAMSAGGLCGSLVVSWVVPVLSNAFVEYPLAIVAVVAASAPANPSLASWRSSWWWRGVLGILLTGGILLATALAFSRVFAGPLAGFVGMAGVLMLLSLSRREAFWLAGMSLAVWLVTGTTKDLLWKARVSEHYRNHYGIYEISESRARRYLTHGTTNHGIQNLEGADRGEPLSYYHRGGPAGALLAALDQGRARHFGMIGLGAGSLAAYSREGDVFEVFELDPLNVKLATSKFTFLSDGEDRGVEVRVHVGDGRLLLAGASHQFDVLILDAFSSGAIPMHLLTREAVSSYLRSVKADGFVLMHISNRILDLRPMIASVGRSLGHEAYFQDSPESPEDPDLKSSDWALLAPAPERSRILAQRHGWSSWEAFADDDDAAELPRPWTDERSALQSVWRR